MQIQQQHQLLYNRVTANDVSAVLTTGNSTAVGGTLHHRQQQQQQQSIEMTQFEIRGTVGGVGLEPSYQKLSKHHQLPNTLGRYNNGATSAVGVTVTVGGEDANARTISTAAGGAGTIGRRRRGGQQVPDGVPVTNGTDQHYGGSVNNINNNNNNSVNSVNNNGQHPYLQQQQQQQPPQQLYGTRRRSNAASTGDGYPSAQPTAAVVNGSSYNTIGGSGGVGYYAADVYASMGTRQQQAKRLQQQQQRPYGVGVAPAGNVSGDPALTAKRSWRRQQNRRRRTAEPGCDADDDSPTTPEPGYAAVSDGPEPMADDADRYNRSAAAQSEQHLHHHHRPRQKNDPVRSVVVQASSAAAEPQINGSGAGNVNGNNGSGASKNVVKFHDVGREIDV